MDQSPELRHLLHTYHRFQEAKRNLSVSQGQFDTDLAAYIAAVNAYISAVGTAARAGVASATFALALPRVLFVALGPGELGAPFIAVSSR